MVATLVLSAALVPLAKRLALHIGVMDAPGARKVHAVPTPRTGGVAVFVSFTTVVLGGMLAAPRLGGLAIVRELIGPAAALLQEAHRVRGKLLAVLAAGAIVFVVGLVDDKLGTRFPWALKALGQLVAALVLVGADIRTSFLPYDWMNAALTVFWLVGVTNAFNLLDNMDGLSAGVAFVASSILLVNAWLLGEFFISLITVAFMGALLGFLIYNWNPASIFLGDCGSLFIGFVMASVTLLERYTTHASSSLFPVLMPVMVLAVPILDTTTVVIIRLKERRPIYVGDSRHLSHRLVSLGLKPKNAVLVIYLVTLCLGLGAVPLADATGVETVLILLQAAAIVAVVLVLLFFERRAVARREVA
jgi:UDP-GlcNAc:undecaprenyl-phosphate GlcNAc-1-phosphate transferase